MMLLLSLIVCMPAVAAMLLVFIPKERGDVVRWLTLMTTIAVLVAVIFMATGFEKADEAAAWMQDAFSLGWIPSFNINYYMGLDGFRFPLVVLTAVVSVFAMGAIVQTVGETVGTGGGWDVSGRQLRAASLHQRLVDFSERANDLSLCFKHGF